jgi:hypothetical protein
MTAEHFPDLSRHSSLWNGPGRLSFLLTTAALCFSLACQKGTIVSGRVTNAKTGEKIPGATVSVSFQRLDANYNWMDGGHANLGTGPSGEFSVNHRNLGGRFVVLAQCEGFYPNYDYQSLRKLERHMMSMNYRVEVRLCPIVSPRPLPKGQEGEVRFSPPARRIGWNFAAAQMVPEATADFVGESDEAGRKIVTLIARGQGGFSRVAGLSGGWALFNMPEAPRDGFQPRVDVREVAEGERACYYVRTADGRHYAKIVMGGTVQSREFCGIRFEWVYQPDGSCALEIPLPQPAK